MYEHRFDIIPHNLASKMYHSSPSDDIPERRFSTDALPAADRLPHCREFFGRLVLRHDLEPVPDSDFRVTTTLRMFPDIALWTVASSPIHFRRTPELLADGNNGIGFCAVSAGQMRFAQYGSERDVPDFFFASVAEPYSVTTTAASTTLVGVRLPREPLAGIVPGLDDALARPIPPGNEAVKLLKRYIGVLDGDPSLACPVLRQPIVTHICDLAALALGAGRDWREIAKTRGLSAARLHAIKADILAASGQPGLTLAALAVRHGVSPRYVQMLFEGEGLTFSQFLLDQRLSRAHRMLSDPRSAGLTITTIAYDAGFADLSYFNRAFRRRYGERPSDVRASGRAGDG
jgi:AraC-like DNA-binding protein